MVLPSIGSQTANRLAQMMTANAQQKRGLAMQAQFGGMDERRRKMDRIHALLQQRMQWVKEREAQKKAKGSGKGAKTGAIAGMVAGALLAPVTGGASLAMAMPMMAGAAVGGGLGAGVGGMFDSGSQQGGMQMGQSIMGTANQGLSLMEKMQKMGLLDLATEPSILSGGS